MKTYVIAIAIIQNSHGDFLIGKRAATKRFAPGQWEFVSGFIDAIDTAENIILKEIEEELNTTGKVTKQLALFAMEDEEGRWVIIPFSVELADENVKADPREHSELRWVRRDELKEHADLDQMATSMGL